VSGSDRPMIEAPPSSLPDLYDGQYRLWLDRKGARALDLDWRLRHLLWRQRALLRRFPPDGKRVLDFGCMDGVFTIRLHQLGAQAVGYDISPAAIAQAERFRGTMQQPTFTTVPPGPGQFDIVYCSEVLEHVEDDRSFIGALVRFLVPGGLLVGTTPVGRFFWDPDHKRAYDESSLSGALTPWGATRIRKYYRTPLRNLLPLQKSGAAVFIFEVRPPNLRDAR
jgi:2-polyprenyl-3-methyl-5-hydroxy-6-metoxy-1,4-benzoquinol methylase